MEEDQSSDTQSMEAGHSPRRTPDIKDAAFPKESDKQKLLDLIRPKSRSGSEDEQPHVQVRKVVSHGFSDSDSSSSDEESRQAVRTKSNHDFDDLEPSLRSSMRSTSGLSAVSSEGRITIVTELNVSDYEVESLRSAYSVQNDQESANYGASNNLLAPNMVHQHGHVNSQHDNPVIDRHSGQHVDNAGGTVQVRRIRRQQDSFSSDSEEDNDQRFQKVPTRRSRSPSPDPASRRPMKDNTSGQTGRSKKR